jgi:predicted nucleic acid-binding protein
VTTLFADSFYFFALANPREPAHRRAAEWAANRQMRLVTTTHVLTEVADGLCKSMARRGAASLIRHLYRSPLVTIVSVDEELFEAGLTRYESRSDKDWSLTDCISFVVMEQQGCSEALTGDHHFTQAGFRALLV